MGAVVESVMRLRPAECPAYAYRDQLVRDVIDLYAARETNLLEPIAGGWDAIPRRLVEGLAFFDRQFRAARAHFRRLEDEQAERERNRARAAR